VPRNVISEAWFTKCNRKKWNARTPMRKTAVTRWSSQRVPPRWNEE